MIDNGRTCSGRERRRQWQAFTGRVALVTGAGAPGGIGYAIARALVAGGAKVCITATTDAHP